jgi:hypothetical protein
MKQKIKRIVSWSRNRMLRGVRELTDHDDLIKPSSINIKDCKSVCLTLGPYRNLTTLTAAILFLHPNCQVLNHAGDRVFRNKRLNFLSDYSQEKLDHFIQYAIRISTKGARGAYGGSIIFSHAFDSRYGMRKAFLRSGGAILKSEINCLFWKESLKTSNLIRKSNVDLASIFEKDERVRFIMPIRNPLSCAISNIKTGLVSIFDGLGAQPGEFEVVQAVLNEILWFAELERAYPDHFFSYFEHEISREMLVRLATFLQLEPNERWLDNALSVMKVNDGYNHDSQLIDFYRQYVKERFVDFPSLSTGLLDFFGGAGSDGVRQTPQRATMPPRSAVAGRGPR